MKIVKVSLTDKITIKYQEPAKGQTTGLESVNVFEINSPEPAEPALYVNINKLRKHVMDICEIDGHVDRIAITSLTFKYDDNNDKKVSFGLDLSLKKTNAVIKIKSPAKNMRGIVEGEADKSLMIPDKEIKIIQQIEKNVVDFIKGKRAQTEIDFNKKSAQDKKKKSGTNKNKSGK